MGGAKALGIDGIAVSAGEHTAVLRAAESTGLPVTTLRLESNGSIRVDELGAVLGAANDAGRRLLVAVHAVNNETGVIQPLERIAVLVGASPHFLFVDAVQALGKMPLEFASSAADMMAVSAHKIGGPQGVGALLMKGHADQVRLIPGGGQETGRRGGTEAAALIAGFGAAAKAFPDRLYAAGTAALIESAEAGMRRLAPDLVVFGADADRIGNVSNFAVPGVKNSVAMMGLAPSARPSMAAASPTGPSPVMSSVSCPDTSRRSSPWYAVPNPHETSAPST